jgi:hypothetical protein
MGILGLLPARPPNPGLKDMGRRATGAPDHVLPPLPESGRRIAVAKFLCAEMAIPLRGAYDPSAEAI